MDSTESNHSGTGSEPERNPDKTKNTGSEKYARINRYIQLRHAANVEERKRWVDNLLKGLARMPPILAEDEWISLDPQARATYLRVNHYRVYQHTHVGTLRVVEFVPTIRDVWGRVKDDR
jgi:hypothetical protein